MYYVGRCQLIGNGEDWYLIDTTGRPVNSLIYSQNAKIIGDYFLDFRDQEIILTPISEFDRIMRAEIIQVRIIL